MLFTAPSVQGGWVTVGPPTPDQFFSLRATPRAMPLASSVPFTMTPEFRRQNAEVVQAFQNGERLLQETRDDILPEAVFLGCQNRTITSTHLRTSATHAVRITDAGHASADIPEAIATRKVKEPSAAAARVGWKAGAWWRRV
jgi:hypothetical protein